MTSRTGAEGTASLRRVPALVRGAVRLVWQADRKTFLLTAGAQLLGAVSLAGVVVVGRWALEGMLAVPDDGTSGVGRLAPALGLLAVVTAVASASSAFQQQQQRYLSEQTSRVVWRQVLDVTARVPLESFESPRFFDRLQRVQNNAIFQPASVATSLFGLLGGGAGTVLILAALLTVEPLLVPLLILAGVPAVLLSRAASRTEFAFSSRFMPLYRRREYLRGVLTGREEAKEIRAFGVGTALCDLHDQTNQTFLAGLREQVRRRQRYSLAVVATNAVALTLTLVLLVWLVDAGRVSLAEAGAAAIGIRLVSTRLDQIFRSTGTLIEASAFLEDLADFLRAPLEPEGRTSCGIGLDRDIVLEDVHYTYPETETPALKGVSLTIPRGKVVALVGENGSGKTTLAKIVAGLYAPSRGRIRWDGRDVQDVPPAEVRRSVAVIFQDFVRYQLTARENIDLSPPGEPTDAAGVARAARLAGAAPFLETLPAGYDTLLGKEFNDGFDLSVGQWQRVALARALHRRAALVILDEPTASLDPRAEHALFDDMRALLGQDRTALLISHRFSSVRSADIIYVMRDGQVAEAGSHAELMAADGLYAELFTLQAKAYV